MGLNKKSWLPVDFWLIIINIIAWTTVIGIMFFLSNLKTNNGNETKDILLSNVYLTSITLNFLNQRISIEEIPEEFKKELIEFFSEKEFYEIRELYYFSIYIQDNEEEQNILIFLEEKRENFLESKEKSLEKFYSFSYGFDIDEKNLEHYKNEFVKLSGSISCNTFEYVFQVSDHGIKRNIIPQFNFINYIQLGNNEFEFDKNNIICFSI